MMGRLLAPVLVVLALLTAAPAEAYWQPPGGSGSGTGPVGTLAATAAPAASATQQTVTVSWAQTWVGGNMLGTITGGGYTVKRYPAGGGASATPGTACNTTITGAAATLSCQETAAPVGSWRYTVTPLLSSWTGPQSATSAIVDVAPVAPSLTSVTAQNPTSGQTTGNIQLAWGAVTSATGYNVFRRTTSGSYNFSSPLNGGTPVTATTYTDPGTGLTGGVTYAYVIRAVAGTLVSTSSNERSDAAIARPAAPTGVTASPAPAGNMSLGWTSVAGAAGYNVYRRTTTGTYAYGSPLNGSTPAAGPTYTDVTAVNGTSYRYEIRTVITGAGGAQVESVSSAETAAATSDAIAPTAVTIADPGTPRNGSVTLSATATDSGSGIASVRLQYAPTGTITWTDGCTGTTSPYSCSLDTAALPDGLYDLRAVATDVAGNTTISTSVTNRRFDNTGPATTMGDPGAYVRGVVNLTATATDPGTGVASVRIQGTATGTTAWADICTDTTSPYSCPLDTRFLADGGYDLRAIAVDAIGNTTTSAPVVNRVVDNTAPTGINVQATNKAGGTAGKPETGDVVTYTFSEPMSPTSILAGWSGASTPVVVRFTNATPSVITVFDAANATQLSLGSFKSTKNYVTANTTFTASTMVRTGNVITVTLGTASGATLTATGTSTLQWTTSTAATDLAGNPMTAGTIAETGVLDLDF